MARAGADPAGVRKLLDTCTGFAAIRYTRVLPTRERFGELLAAPSVRYLTSSQRKLKEEGAGRARPSDRPAAGRLTS